MLEQKADIYSQTERVFTLKAISTKPASEIQFLLNGKDGQPDKMVSLTDYFKSTYNKTVTKPRLPAVMFGARNFIP